MWSVVTLDVRRLITVTRTAMIPTPSAIANQNAIVYPLFRVRPPRVASERPAWAFATAGQHVEPQSSCPGKGKEWAGRGGGREAPISLELLGIFRGATRPAPFAEPRVTARWRAIRLSASNR